MTVKEQAYLKVDHELLPEHLESVLKELAYWNNRLKYARVTLNTLTIRKAYTIPAERKITEIQEIIAVFTQDALQINRRLSR